MQKSIEAAKKIMNAPDESGYPILKDVNLHMIFDPIYEMGLPLPKINAIVSFVIYAYDNDSLWLNLKADRYQNKINILKSLTPYHETQLFTDIASNANPTINEIIGEYLIEQTTWKWHQIMTALDFHSSTLRFVGKSMEKEKQTGISEDSEGIKKIVKEDFDMDVIAKVGKQKGELLKQALESRQDADTLLAEIRKEFVQMEHAVQSDFGFSISDEKKVDPTSWRQFIKHKNEKNKALLS